MNFNEQQRIWIDFHDKNIDFHKYAQQQVVKQNYSFGSDVFTEMAQEHFPNALTEIVEMEEWDQLDLFGIGTALYPEYFPSFVALHHKFPHLKLTVQAVDLAFTLPDSQRFFLNAVTQLLFMHLNEFERPTQEHMWTQYQLFDLLISVSPLFDSQLTLPSHTKQVALSAFHILNYISGKDFAQFIQDPRIKILCIANKFGWGKKEAFSAQSFTSIDELFGSLENEGFQMKKYHQSRDQLQHSMIYIRY